MKFKVNPLFFALALALVAFGHALDFVWTLLALLFHEGAHALMARARGYVVKKIVLLPYGAMMSAGENFDQDFKRAYRTCRPLLQHRACARHPRFMVAVSCVVSLYDCVSVCKLVAWSVQSFARLSA